jgi:hypothetical protein
LRRFSAFYERRQKSRKGTRFAVVSTQRCSDFARAFGEASGSIRTDGSNEPAPCAYVAAHDDVLDRGFRELSAGFLGEVPVPHERRIERHRADFEHQPESRTNPLDLRETELLERSGLERRQR